MTSTDTPRFRVRCLGADPAGDSTHYFDSREDALAHAGRRWDAGGLHGVVVAERQYLEGRPIWAAIWFAPTT